MPRGADQHVTADFEPQRKLFGHRRRYNRVLTGGKDQQRYLHVDRIIRLLHRSHRPIGGAQPSNRRRTKRQVWCCINDRAIAFKPLAILGLAIALERHNLQRLAFPANRIAAALSQQAGDFSVGPNGPWRMAASLLIRYRDHRRRRDNALEPGACLVRVAQHDVSTQRVAKPKVRWRAVRQHDLFHETREVLVVVGKATDVSTQWVIQQPVRSALSPQVHDRDTEATPAQISHDLEVLFDRFATAGHDAYGAASGTARFSPAGKPDLDAVEALEEARVRAAWNRVLCK